MVRKLPSTGPDNVVVATRNKVRWRLPSALRAVCGRCLARLRRLPRQGQYSLNCSPQAISANAAQKRQVMHTFCVGTQGCCMRACIATLKVSLVDTMQRCVRLGNAMLL